MVESHLNAGSQTLGADPSDLAYGVSITDACIDWGHTDELVRHAHAQLGELRP
jgi:3-deoxy-7-phosphoheptulonate synthase